MLTEQSFRNYIESLGHRPACTPICVDKINRLSKSGKINFDFYVNLHNLCWFVDDNFKRINPQLSNEYFTLNLRDFKLYELLNKNI